ncbi:branched-chain amino acid ABC transporter permease [Methylobacterium sp. NEAU 140]|uniref:branched-chain amino acid ABC transporter permease n=1 Tax=Methylobacterium sp. NEAU 140 TaxID=3064945 RepID=UPI0027364D01|nr:branched-chain amino acid ABC transporter permease [Methylobacterium sp. NEAU 140]MDP4026490.1 branched-chain amino acid ABC transporter permease [Methylobacterium sp. NEAU 140]
MNSYSLFTWRHPALSLLMIVSVGTAASYGHPFLLDNSIMIGIFSLMALSVGISYGQAGILSLATATFAAIGAFATAILTVNYRLSPYLGLLAAILLPTVCAYLLARCILRLSPLPLSIATFVLGGLVEVLIKQGGDFTGGYIGLSGIPRLSIAPSAQAMHFLTWAVVLLVVVLCVSLMNSSTGRAINTARHDPLRAVADGVDVPHLLSNTFAFSGAIAGVAGWLYAHHITYIGPDSLTTQVSITVLLMAVVGGVKVILGPIFGAAILMVVVLYLPAAESQGMFFGSILVFMLLVAPNGLLGSRWRLPTLRGGLERPTSPMLLMPAKEEN